MQDSTNRLVTSNGIATNFFLAPDSSPAIADLGSGVVETAFVAGDHTLWRGSPETNAFHAGFEIGATLHVAPGSSPAIAGDGNGGWKIAFHAASGRLLTIDSQNRLFDSTNAMAPGTSPSIDTDGAGGFEIAFHAQGDHLWIAQAERADPSSIVLAPGSSPAMTGRTTPPQRPRTSR